MTTLSLPYQTRPLRRPAADLGHGTRIFLATGAGMVLILILCALARAAGGLAPHGAALKEAALAIHLAAVVPAIPLGAWVLFRRKGGARHRMLGKMWLALMVTGAVSALWIRHLSGGSLSAIHLLVPIVLVTAWRAVAAARRGDIVAHKRGLVILFTTGLLIPGLIALLPGRLMWLWLVG